MCQGIHKNMTHNNNKSEYNNNDILLIVKTNNNNSNQSNLESFQFFIKFGKQNNKHTQHNYNRTDINNKQNRRPIPYLYNEIQPKNKQGFMWTQPERTGMNWNELESWKRLKWI